MTKPLGIIFDIDGTVLRGEQMIPGARQTIDALRLQGHPLLFITNALESLELDIAMVHHSSLTTALVLNTEFS